MVKRFPFAVKLILVHQPGVLYEQMLQQIFICGADQPAEFTSGEVRQTLGRLFVSLH